MSVRLQDFETRVVGPIGAHEALALIEASRSAIRHSGYQGSDEPTTAVMIRPMLNDEGYRITWGTPEGYARISFEARLVDGADPTVPDDWQIAPAWVSDKE